MASSSSDDGGMGDIFNPGSGAGKAETGERSEGKKGGGTGLTRDRGVTTERLGRSGRIGFDSRLLRHSVAEARSGDAVSWHISKNDRMSAKDAGDLLVKIHEMFQVNVASHGAVEAFNNALFFSFTINSGSTLQPGRAVLEVAGSQFIFQDVVEFLGADLRRFSRAFADVIKDVNLKVMAERYRAHDVEAQERYAWLMEVASDRDLLRYPELSHDSSSACWHLTPSQRSALANAKAGVFMTILNTADSIGGNGRVKPQNNTIHDNPAGGRGNVQ